MYRCRSNRGADLIHKQKCAISHTTRCKVGGFFLCTVHNRQFVLLARVDGGKKQKSVFVPVSDERQNVPLFRVVFQVYFVHLSKKEDVFITIVSKSVRR